MKNISVLLLVIGSFLFGFHVSSRIGPEEIVETDTVTVTKIEKRVDTIFLAQRETIKEEVKLPPDTVYKPTDSADLALKYNNLLEEHYTEKYIRDSVEVDTLGLLKIHDVLYANTIQERSVTYDFEIPTRVETITEIRTVKPTTINVGLTAGPQGFGPGVVLNHKQDYLYYVGYEFGTGEHGFSSVRFGAFINLNTFR